ncbi:NAD(P)-dependent oxidoreductase [Streptomyces sp. NPDC002701]|uniref:NAD(P)-dependent oxidoreductase n=1 Tax=Streptomyces sp. NPDC002701 TaxID=3364661 RepID=UPI00369A97BF
MKITLFGTGFVGSALARELVEVGHTVTAVARHPDSLLAPSVSIVAGSVHDPAVVADTTAGAEVIVSALSPLDDNGGLPASTSVLAVTADKIGARLGVVGSSAILPVTPDGPRHADTAGFPDWLADRVTAHQRTLDQLGNTPDTLDWFYLAAPGEFGPHARGVRTGRYRTSVTAQVSDATGRSRIGVEDYCIAFAGELQVPTVHRGWLTVGY